MKIQLSRKKYMKKLNCHFFGQLNSVINASSKNAMMSVQVFKRFATCVRSCLQTQSVLMIVSLWILLICIKPVNSLQCYTCAEEDTNDNCIGTNTVRTCSRTQDRCLTQTIYSKERGKLRIDKSCASEVGCIEAEAQLGKKYFCDTSRAGWGCVECCSRDRCNESTGVRIMASVWMIFLCAFASIVCLMSSLR